MVIRKTDRKMTGMSRRVQAFVYGFDPQGLPALTLDYRFGYVCLDPNQIDSMIEDLQEFRKWRNGLL